MSNVEDYVKAIDILTSIVSDAEYRSLVISIAKSHPDVLVCAHLALHQHEGSTVDNEVLSPLLANVRAHFPNLGQHQLWQVASHIDGGGKVQAIKQLREYTSLSLKEANDVVDSVEYRQGHRHPRDVDIKLNRLLAELAQAIFEALQS